MDAELIEDQIAVDIAEFTKDGAGVVTFCGWLHLVDGSDTLRIFDDGDFVEFVEIDVDDVVAQIPGADRGHENFRSVIWVDANATVTRGQRSTALFISPGSPRMANGIDPVGGGYVPPSKRP